MTSVPGFAGSKSVPPIPALGIGIGGGVVNTTTNWFLWSSDLSNAAWTKRGVATATITADSAPVSGTFYTECLVNTVGTGDIYQIVAGDFTPTTIVSMSFFLKPVTTSGSLRVDNLYGFTNGRWEIDLSLVDTDGERIVTGHPAVTEVNPWRSNGNGSVGPVFYPVIAGDMTFKVASLNLTETTEAYSPIETTTTPVTA